MGKDTIILHLDWDVFLARLTDQQLGQWTRAVFNYMATGEEPSGLDQPVEIAFYATFERIGRDQAAWSRKISGLKQYQEKTQDHRKPPYGVRTDGVPVPVPDPVPVPVSSSSDDRDNGCAVTTTTHKLMGKLEENFGKATGRTAERLQKALDTLPEELADTILETCLDNNARTYNYFLQATDKVIAQGIQTVAEYKAGHKSGGSGHNIRVDRTQPSGNDWITASMDRPRQLKRKEGE